MEDWCSIRKEGKRLSKRVVRLVIKRGVEGWNNAAFVDEGKA